MSAERNLELARRAFDAFSRRDFEGLAKEIHPDVEWHVAFRAPDRPLAKDVYRGREEVVELMKGFSSAWSSLTAEIEDFVHVDDERLVLRVRFRGHGEESGVDVDQVLFYSYRVRDDQLIYSHAFQDEASARRDAGLDVD